VRIQSTVHSLTPAQLFRFEDASTKVDVYSFAIVSYELQSRQLFLSEPVMRASENGPVAHDPLTWGRATARGQRPLLPESWPAYLRDLIAGCWAAEPDERLTMKGAMDVLRPLLIRSQFTTASGWLGDVSPLCRFPSTMDVSDKSTNEDSLSGPARGGRSGSRSRSGGYGSVESGCACSIQ
jgi:hypothetical protein